jgi:hypothetical protein
MLDMNLRRRRGGLQGWLEGFAVGEDDRRGRGAR